MEKNEMKPTEAQISEAQINGLDAKGLDAMRKGDRNEFKRALDRLAARQPGNIYQCWTGYKIWFDSATKSERTSDYNRCCQKLEAICR